MHQWTEESPPVCRLIFTEPPRPKQLSRVASTPRQGLSIQISSYVIATASLSPEPPQRTSSQNQTELGTFDLQAELRGELQGLARRGIKTCDELVATLLLPKGATGRLPTVVIRTPSPFALKIRLRRLDCLLCSIVSALKSS